MGNTSKKRRNKRLWTGGIIAVIALIIISFVVSNNDEQIDEAAVAAITVEADGPHIKGNPEAEFIITEFSDFQCPSCKAAAPQVTSIVESYSERLAVEYKHFPLRSIHPNAQLAAQASEAAANQGMFWEMHDLLFEKQSEWSQSFNPERYFREYAQELGLNVDRFRYDLNSDDIKDRVNENYDEATELQLSGTPSFVYNGERVDLNEFIAENLLEVEVTINNQEGEPITVPTE